MVHGIINSVVQGDDDCIDIQIYDIEKCFDALWLEDCLNDVIETLPEDKCDDEIALVYEASKVNLVAVKTAVGLTERKDFPSIVQQGGTWGSLLCANTIEKIGRECSNQILYLNKQKTIVLPLRFIDDLNII